LYLEAIEVVLSTTTKVMVDLDEGSNILYLPLDRVMQTEQHEAATVSGSNRPPPPPMTDAESRPARVFQRGREVR
jgi:membrane protease subunit HflK